MENLTLEQFIARLRGRVEVDGLIVMGSAAGGAPQPHSDYDLLLVLAAWPAPLNVGLTWIDGRLTDLIFITTAELEALLASGPTAEPANSLTGRLIDWLRTGRIALDRTGRLARARVALQLGSWTRGPVWSEQYATWFSLNYDLAQTRRLAAATDPAAQAVVDLRLLFGLSNVWFGYFQLRGLPQFGKDAARYLAEHDPRFLALFQGAAGEPDRLQRLEIYAELVQQVLAPFGTVWTAGATALQFRDEAELDQASAPAAMAWWHALVGAPQSDQD